MTGVRAYYRSLMAKHRNKRTNDPKVKEAKRLLQRMSKASRREKGITVREVVLIDRL